MGGSVTALIADPVHVLLTDLHGRGVRIAADGDHLRFRPAAAVDDRLRARLRRHKAALLALLSCFDAVRHDGASKAAEQSDADAGPAIKVPDLLSQVRATFADCGAAVVRVEPVRRYWRRRTAQAIRHLRSWQQCGAARAVRDAAQERVAICLESDDVPNSTAWRIAGTEGVALAFRHPCDGHPSKTAG